MKKIELPIQVEEPNPKKMDWRRLKDMLISLLIMFIIIFWCFYLFSELIVRNISIQQEKELFSEWDCNKLDISKYIDYKIPEFEEYNICLLDLDEVNAYAWLGWNIYVTKWLLNYIKTQEELVFILAHEVGHIVHRDIIRRVVNKMSFSIWFYILAKFLWIDVGNLADLVELSNTLYSKAEELEADKYAINLCKKYRVNLNCVIDFFKNDDKLYDTLMLLSDHPLNQTRIKLIKKNISNDKKICKKLKIH